MTKPQGIGLVLIVALLIAGPAAAHVPPPGLAPAIDLRDEITAQERVQALPVFAGEKLFDEVAHVALPVPSVADELARRFAADDIEERSDLAIFDRTVSRKLASGPLGVFEEGNVNVPRELSLELRRTVGNARARWYDPATGSFLSPDPMGYQDSSNLYAFCAGDPVNCSDPTGEAGGARPAVRPPIRAPLRPPAPGTRVRPGTPQLVPDTPPPIRPAYAPGDWLTFRAEIEAAKASRPKGAGARVFHGRTADELSPAAQADFLEHRRRLRNDPAYRAQWEAMEAGTLDLQAELLPMPLPAIGGAGGGDDGDDGRGWTVGDPVLKLTRSGRMPSWSTQRARFWKNESAKPGAEAEYGSANVARMRKGLAPQRYNFFTGQMESKELSHEPVPQREGGTRVVPRWPGDHAAHDAYRNTGNTRAIVKNDNQ